MTYPINSQSQQIPGYSGITINITNPNISSGPHHHQCPPPPNPQYLTGQNCLVSNPVNANNASQNYTMLPQPQNNYGLVPQGQANVSTREYSAVQDVVAEEVSPISSPYDNNYGLAQQNSSNATQQPLQQGQQAYPAEYYINNYNYVQNGKQSTGAQPVKTEEASSPVLNNSQPDENEALNQVADVTSLPVQVEEKEADLTSSKNIINELDTKLAEQKELEKKGKKTRVVALTNEYIMSLENYLNNPNTEIRLMAAKEILTRLDEDKDRFDDAALNALLNKMLQDPEKLVRVAALSALTSELASGNDYTVKLLNDIQSNPNADKEDVVDAANILLKMSAATEVKYLPQPQNQQTSVQ